MRTPLELFALALAANWGGSKPPTREDISHTILRMLELGASKRSIAGQLAFLPKGSCRAYIDWAASVLAKRRKTRALEAVADGMSVQDASGKYGVKPEVLKDAIVGKKRKWGKDRSSDQQQLIEFLSYASKALRSANSGISKKVEGLLKQVEDGELNPNICEKAIRAWHEHLRKTGLRVADWQARLSAISQEQEKSMPTKARGGAELTA